MADFDIPEDHIEALINYLKFDDARKESFLSVLREAGIGIRMDELLEKVLAVFDEDQTAMKSLMETVISLLFTREDYNGEDFTQRVVNDDRFKAAGIDRDMALKEIESILSTNKSLIFSVKAQQLAHSRGKILSEGKIYADVRPLFLESGDEDIIASVVIYTLKLTYYQDGSIKTSFFGLDEMDLDDLSEQIARAKRKKTSIEKSMEKLDVKLISY